MLVCWSRRDKWILGFGPIPIILSTNLFLWFKDDWFFLQFAMISIGVVAKEYVQWNREGRHARLQSFRGGTVHFLRDPDCDPQHEHQLGR
jgi:hypothetical protein